MTSKKRIIAALNSQPIDRKPIWIMRQAGRYLPEYQKLRKSNSFLKLVKSPELATEITLQPLDRFNLDAAIIFSDILVIPEALGQSYSFADGGGIKMEFKVDSQKKISDLDTSNLKEKLSYVFETIKLVKNSVGEEKAVLGFGGSPWTLATYMVEGQSSKSFELLKSLYYQDYKLFDNIMDKLCSSLVTYFKYQIESGVDAIQIFDTWGVTCPADHYWDMSLQWIQKIIAQLPENFPVILYTKNMVSHLKSLLKTGAQCLSLDWTVCLPEVYNNIPTRISVQGNLDPNILLTNPKIVENETLNFLKSMNNCHGHVINLGHGILPNSKIENVEMLVESVRQYKIEI